MEWHSEVQKKYERELSNETKGNDDKAKVVGVRRARLMDEVAQENFLRLR